MLSSMPRGATNLLPEDCLANLSIFREELSSCRNRPSRCTRAFAASLQQRDLKRYPSRMLGNRSANHRGSLPMRLRWSETARRGTPWPPSRQIPQGLIASWYFILQKARTLRVSLRGSLESRRKRRELVSWWCAASTLARRRHCGKPHSVCSTTGGVHGIGEMKWLRWWTDCVARARTDCCI